jgi:endonuclease/exonuclease/phosphatase family metal-dependent hydrolase
MKKQSKKIKSFLILFTIILFLLPSYAAESIKVMNWNLLHFSRTGAADRIDDFLTVLDEVDVDILVVQEVYDEDGAKFLLTDGLRRTSPNKYRMGDFYDDPDSDLELSVFYNSKEIKYFKKSFTVVDADPRVICGYQFKVKTGKAKGAKFWIYAVHLKASPGSTNENDRATAARILRDHLNDKPKDSLILVGGDYNLYTNNEKTWWGDLDRGRR